MQKRNLLFSPIFSLEGMVLKRLSENLKSAVWHLRFISIWTTNLSPAYGSSLWQHIRVAYSPHTIITHLQGILVYKSTQFTGSLEMWVAESICVAIIARVSIRYGRLIWIINHRKGVRHKTVGRINCQEILSTESKLLESSWFHDTCIHNRAVCASTPLLNARHHVAGEKLWISSGPSFQSACHTLEH